LIHFIVQPTDEIMTFNGFICGGAENTNCWKFKLVLFIRKKPVDDIFSIGIRCQNLYPFLGFNVSIIIKIQNKV